MDDLAKAQPMPPEAWAAAVALQDWLTALGLDDGRAALGGDVWRGEP